MNLTETAAVLTIVASYDRRTLGETDVRSWHEVFAAAGLPDLSFDDAKAAVVDHYARTRDWLMPVDVIRFCKTLRRQRIAQAGDLYALVDVDPADAVAYHEAYLKIRANVASGRRTMAELEAGK